MSFCELMDVMLRFRGADAVLQKALQDQGYELIIPQREKDQSPPNEMYQVVLVKADQVDTPSELDAYIHGHLIRLGATLMNRNPEVTAELDIGMDPSGLGSYRSARLKPATLLQLSSQRIELCVTVYWPSEPG